MKIFITYAYAGIGHKKAGEAVYGALIEQITDPSSQVKIFDALDYTNKFFRFVYPRMYLFLINRTPLLWGFFYYILDLRIIDVVIRPFRRFLHWINARRFARLIIEERPDIIVSTHFFPSEVIGILKHRGLFNGKLITIITDLLPHSFWVIPESDYFIVAIERTKDELMRRFIEEDRIKVLGIPCEKRFGIKKDKDALMKTLGLEKGFFNLLIMGGGFGSGPIKALSRFLCSYSSGVNDRLQLIVICGKNKSLFSQLDRIKKDLNARMHIFGYMDNIDEFMEVSDCIVTKSGGLTISEALSKNLPMIIIRPIPGQETRNCKILVDCGVAIRANNIKSVKRYIVDFIKNPEKIIDMKLRMYAFMYPLAAKDIADFVLTL